MLIYFQTGQDIIFLEFQKWLITVLMKRVKYQKWYHGEINTSLSSWVNNERHFELPVLKNVLQFLNNGDFCNWVMRGFFIRYFLFVTHGSSSWELRLTVSKPKQIYARYVYDQGVLLKLMESMNHKIILLAYTLIRWYWCA